MAGIVLHQPVLTLADDPDGLPLFLLRSDLPAFDGGLQGEVREYAGGERIASSRRGRSESAQGTVVTDPAGLRLLQAWEGLTVCYRDGLGSKLFCVYQRTPWQPSQDGRLRYVSLRVDSVTYVEAV